LGLDGASPQNSGFSVEATSPYEISNFASMSEESLPDNNHEPESLIGYKVTRTVTIDSTTKAAQDLGYGSDLSDEREEATLDKAAAEALLQDFKEARLAAKALVLQRHRLPSMSQPARDSLMPPKRIFHGRRSPSHKPLDDTNPLPALEPAFISDSESNFNNTHETIISLPNTRTTTTRLTSSTSPNPSTAVPPKPKPFGIRHSINYFESHLDTFIALTLIMATWLIPSYLFALTEGWSYADSIYFTFIVLTTTGYGDL
jgi:hypothetical protein